MYISSCGKLRVLRILKAEKGQLGALRKGDFWFWMVTGEFLEALITEITVITRLVTSVGDV
jgi:hypothetical protein